MPSFDVQSSFDKQEVTNAVDQAQREISTRYDFKGTQTSVEFKDSNIQIISSTADRLQAANQVLIEKLIKRNESSKILSNFSDSKDSKSNIKRTYILISGISQEDAKKLVKNIKEFNKKIQASIQGPIVRISSKKKDDLQQVIAFIKEMNLDYPLKFINFKD